MAWLLSSEQFIYSQNFLYMEWEKKKDHFSEVIFMTECSHLLYVEEDGAWPSIYSNTQSASED